MIVRKMTRQDIDQILIIERASFKSPWSRQAFENEMDNNLGHYFVAQQDDAVIGYAGFWQIFDEAHITNIAILPDCRGTGYGKQLVGEVIEQARLLGVNYVTLEVRPSNAVALSLYRSFGFAVKGKRPRYYYDTGEDALIMWAKINKTASDETIL